MPKLEITDAIPRAGPKWQIIHGILALYILIGESVRIKDVRVRENIRIILNAIDGYEYFHIPSYLNLVLKSVILRGISREEHHRRIFPEGFCKITKNVRLDTRVFEQSIPHIIKQKIDKNLEKASQSLPVDIIHEKTFYKM